MQSQTGKTASQTEDTITNCGSIVANLQFRNSDVTCTARCDNGQVGQKDTVILCENEAASRDSQHLAELG